MAGRISLTTVNDGFVGMIEHLLESFFDLLDKEVSSDSESSNRSHDPSRECHMAQMIPVSIEEGDGQANPVVNVLGDAAAVDALLEPPPATSPEQLHARRRELEQARLQLAAEEATIDRELRRRATGGRAQAMARDVNHHIVNDDSSHP